LQILKQQEASGKLKIAANLSWSQAWTPPISRVSSQLYRVTYTDGELPDPKFKLMAYHFILAQSFF
jgi:hypothetical protein